MISRGTWGDILGLSIWLSFTCIFSDHGPPLENKNDMATKRQKPNTKNNPSNLFKRLPVLENTKSIHDKTTRAGNSNLRSRLSMVMG